MTVRELYNVVVAITLGFLFVWAIIWAFELKPLPAPMPEPSPCTPISTEYTYCTREK